MGDNVRLENHWRNPADLSVMLYHQEGAVTDQVLACRSVLYTAQCTLHTVQCTLYTTYCTLFTALCTLTTVHCTMYAGHCYKIDHTALPSKNYGAYWTCQTTNSFFAVTLSNRTIYIAHLVNLVLASDSTLYPYKDETWYKGLKRKTPPEVVPKGKA